MEVPYRVSLYMRRKSTLGYSTKVSLCIPCDVMLVLL